MNPKNYRKSRATHAVAVTVILCCFGTLADAATWYVDSAATGARNGRSWADAWTNVNQITGVSAGDVVYVSGGPTGQSRTYNLSSAWTPTGGATGNPVAYRIGNDAQHNGVAIFNSGPSDFIDGTLNNVVISGDAGDGAMHFQLGTVAIAFFVNGSSNLRISYVNCGKQQRTPFRLEPGTNIEIDHCYCNKLTHSEDDCMGVIVSTNLKYDSNKIHDNEFHMPRSTTNTAQAGYGDDGWVGKNWSGVSFYRNKVIAYGIANYLAGQHQDGHQPLGGDHIKCYDNYYENVATYPFYGDAFYGGFTNLYIFNNILVLTDAGVQGQPSPQGIAIGSEMDNAPFNNIVVANNLIADYADHPAVNLGDGGSGTISYGPNVGLYNNLATNNGNANNGHPVFGNQGNPKVANLNNVNLLPLTNGAGIFVSYTQNRGGIADFHLKASATLLIGKGTNLSANGAQCPEIMFDRDGKPRPTSGAWDIGPYVVGGGQPAAPTRLRIVPKGQ